MLRRILQPLVNLLHQRQFYVLLVLLAPLMFSLRWMAVRFPTLFPDYVQTRIFEIEPDKLAVVFESGRWGHIGDERARALLLNIESETLRPIPCPPEIGPEWSGHFGIDLNKNYIFETRSKAYVGWHPRTGIAYQVGHLQKPLLVNSRYLVSTTDVEPGNEFTWYDLAEPNRGPRRVPIMFTEGGITPIDETNSFYFVLSPEDRSWLNDGLLGEEGMMGMGMMDTADYAPAPPIDYSDEWVNDDGSVEYELPPVVVNPNAPPALATVVLMNLTEQGPKEVARWPVFEGSGSEITSAPGYVISQNIDGDFLETRDACSGEVVARVPVPKVVPPTTGSTRFNYWRVTGRIISFDDGTGLRVAFDCTTGKQIDAPLQRAPRTDLYVCDQDAKEYLVQITQGWKDWPGEMQVRSVQNNQLLYAWVPPITDFRESQFAADGKSVLLFTSDLRVVFVDKATGRIVRHIQPRFWLPYLAVVLGLATLVWLVLWIRTSTRSGLPLWVDELVIFAIAMTYIYWRINLSGNPYEGQRLAWMCLGAMLVAALALVVNQTMFRNVRLLRRCAPITLLTVAAIFGQWKWSDFAQTSDILAEVLLVGVIVLGSIGAHFLFFRKQRLTRVVPDPVRRGFSLAELFAWTALVALVLAPLRLYDWEDWTRGMSLEWLLETLCVVGVISAVSLSAYFLTAMRCYLVFRLFAGCVLAMLIAVSVAYRQSWFDLDSNVIGSLPFRFFGMMSECLLVMSVASTLVALPVGMRNSKTKTLVADES